MACMVPEIWEADYYLVETNHGSEIVPVEASGVVVKVDGLRDYLDGDPYDPDEPATVQRGWIARTTEPGGKNSTLLVVAPTYGEAVALLREVENLYPDYAE